jgi:4-amino-4-deoxy-L-arabinose transferase-like glycosyltransferase
MLTESRAPQNKAVLLISALIVVGLLGYAVIVVSGVEFFQSIPYWFIVPHRTAVNSWIVAAALAFFVVTLICVHRSRRQLLKLLLVFVAGIVIQFSFGMAKGGIDSIGSRMVHTGHAQFMRLAIKIDNIADFIRDYEKLVSENKLGFFAPSKPPGTAIIYVVTHRLSQQFQGHEKPASLSTAETESRLVRFAIYSWTVIACLPIILIYLLGLRLSDKKTALLAALLYATVPSVALINLHTDQAFYPLMSVLSVLLVVKACQENNLGLAFLAGIVFFLTSFLSFGLLVIAVLFLWIFLSNENLKKSINLSLAFSLGLLLTGLVFYWSFQYNHIERYLNATAYHVSVKGWDHRLETLFLAGSTNLIEYCLWIGLPLAILSFYAFKNVSLINFKYQSLATKVLTAIFIIIITLIVFGKTKAETARLWMFLTPFMCLMAAKVVKDLARSDLVFVAFSSFVVVAQVLSGYLLLRYQDFL